MQQDESGKTWAPVPDPEDGTRKPLTDDQKTKYKRARKDRSVALKEKYAVSHDEEEILNQSVYLAPVFCDSEAAVSREKFRLRQESKQKEVILDITNRAVEEYRRLSSKDELSEDDQQRLAQLKGYAVIQSRVGITRSPQHPVSTPMDIDYDYDSDIGIGIQTHLDVVESCDSSTSGDEQSDEDHLLNDIEEIMIQKQKESLCVPVSRHHQKEEGKAQSWAKSYEIFLELLKCHETGGAGNTRQCSVCSNPVDGFCENCKLRLCQDHMRGHPDSHVITKPLFQTGTYNALLCQCQGLAELQIDIYQVAGVKRVSIKHCHIHSGSRAETLLRNGFWPGTPKKPPFGFTLDAMRGIYHQIVACKSSVQDVLAVFSRGALCGTNPIDMSEEWNKVRKKSYESVSQFVRLFHVLKGVVVSQCPVCFPPEGVDHLPVVYVAIDGNFQLSRRKEGKRDHREPLFSDEVVKNPPSVDVSSIEVDIDCGSCKTRAGDGGTSGRKDVMMDPTGVVGACCRHDIPIAMTPMTHGEKYFHAEALLLWIRDTLLRPGRKIAVMYDIACQFEKYMRKRHDDIDEWVSVFAIPVFHAYGHQMSCQIDYHPRRMEGFGLSNGEGNERIWSHLDRLHNQLLEMRRCVWVDTLSLHVTTMQSDRVRNLDKFLERLLRNAHSLRDSAKSEIRRLEGEHGSKLKHQAVAFRDWERTLIPTGDTTKELEIRPVVTELVALTGVKHKTGHREIVKRTKKRQVLQKELQDLIELHFPDEAVDSVMNFGSHFWNESHPQHVREYADSLDSFRRADEEIEILKKEITVLRCSRMKSGAAALPHSMESIEPPHKDAENIIEPHPLVQIPADLNERQKRAFKAAVHDRKSVFVTGGAGVGKTYTVNKIVKEMREMGLRVVVSAMTAAAGMHVDGTTFHRASGYRDDSDRLHSSIVSADVLVVDEISMMSAEMLERFEQIARQRRAKRKAGRSEMFGGLQVLFSGDFLQLGSVNESLKRLWESAVWKAAITSVELTEVRRQNDGKFIHILNKLRIGDVDDDVCRFMQSMALPLDSQRGEQICLCSTNQLCDKVNCEQLQAITGEEREFPVENTDVEHGQGDMNLRSVSADSLKLKIGAPVLYTVNNHSKRLYNGLRGIVVDFSTRGNPVVDFEEIGEKELERTAMVCDGAVVLQFAVILGWAITIHKGQGMSLDNLIVDLQGVFAEGQVYVAVSRAVSEKTCQVLNFEPSKVKTDLKAVQFYEQLRNDEQ